MGPMMVSLKWPLSLNYQTLRWKVVRNEGGIPPFRPPLRLPVNSPQDRGGRHVALFVPTPGTITLAPTIVSVWWWALFWSSAGTVALADHCPLSWRARPRDTCRKPSVVWASPQIWPIAVMMCPGCMLGCCCGTAVWGGGAGAGGQGGGLEG